MGTEADGRTIVLYLRKHEDVCLSLLMGLWRSKVDVGGHAELWQLCCIPSHDDAYPRRCAQTVPSCLICSTTLVERMSIFSGHPVPRKATPTRTARSSFTRGIVVTFRIPAFGCCPPIIRITAAFHDDVIDFRPSAHRRRLFLDRQEQYVRRGLFSRTSSL
ncbi:hypothetical protein EDD18DRAFT_663927 [Armillaria luteobubalina]|uniref:Uncharacterized protein n=1 Tax=Armillaria luteobubalina TaxID=153913 RepID=A0AA39UEZ5_9AGAR|nr:hypothetical protein EDD18DRAFT_663927 [Armillaria luteobubalina]